MEDNMKFIKYDNKKLINFYVENGLEFDEYKGYFGTDVKSFVLLENKKNSWCSVHFYL